MRTPDDYAYDGAPNPFEAIPIVRFDPATGAITQYGQLSRMVVDSYRIDQQQPILEGIGASDTHWVDLATMTIQPKRNIQAVVDGTTIRNLPIPCTLTIDGDTYEVDDGEAELSFDASGTFQVTVTALQYFPRTFTVTA